MTSRTWHTIGLIYLSFVVTALVTAFLTVQVSHWLTETSSGSKPTIVAHAIPATSSTSQPTVMLPMNIEENEYDPKLYCTNKNTGLPNYDRRKKKKLTIFLYAFLTGTWGVDRFVTGYTVQGVFKVLTVGGLGIWTLVDWILVLTDKRTEKDGCPFYDNM